ncbi:hypothetical protein KSS87_018374 [Heliosperma pusillum]|nr:hypothetical protein KSS87_018374 [Heliosperma pusillum]
MGPSPGPQPPTPASGLREQGGGVLHELKGGATDLRGLYILPNHVAMKSNRAVRLILKGYRVRMDERDLSMDSAYVEELEKVTGSKGEKIVKKLPRVYVNGKYIGGVDEVRRMHESGELVRLLQGVPTEAVEKGGVNGGGCTVCGGGRYVVCEYCDGSHKVYVCKNDGFRSCLVCNVNGLVKCPSCTSVVF